MTKLKENRRLLKNAGTIDPADLSSFMKAGAYKSFSKALQQQPDTILDTIHRSGLRGRGGAGFPTGTKTRAVSNHQEACNRYLVCNADEGEPGTFKDRILMEQDPHLLVEGILIAAYAIGASYGYIYIRGEYFLSIERLSKAIADARRAGWIGRNINNSGFDFEIEIMRGAGSYLCGEELTLLESLEGKRGYPRIKPPFPADKGLWGQPTLVNNVETLANLPGIVAEGPDVFRSLGTEGSPGTKLVCISGDVKKPGVYEVAMGCRIIDIIQDLAGGPKEGSELGFALLGGAAGTFASIEQLELPLCYDALRKEGLSLGSGAIMVFGTKASLSDLISSVLEFFKHESCGKCVPCRLGTFHLLDQWEDSRKGDVQLRLQTLQAISAEASKIAASCLCPLGQSPIMPLSSALKNLPHQLD